MLTANQIWKANVEHTNTPLSVWIFLEKRAYHKKYDDDQEEKFLLWLNRRYNSGGKDFWLRHLERDGDITNENIKEFFEEVKSIILSEKCSKQVVDETVNIDAESEDFKDTKIYNTETVIEQPKVTTVAKVPVLQRKLIGDIKVSTGLYTILGLAIGITVLKILYNKSKK